MDSTSIVVEGERSRCLGDKRGVLGVAGPRLYRCAGAIPSQLLSIAILLSGCLVGE